MTNEELKEIKAVIVATIKEVLKPVVGALARLSKGGNPMTYNRPAPSTTPDDNANVEDAEAQVMDIKNGIMEKEGGKKCERMNRTVVPRVVGAGQEVEPGKIVPLWMEEHSCWHLYNKQKCYRGENRFDPFDEVAGCPIAKKLFG
jgi:hypothetical protein